MEYAITKDSLIKVINSCVNAINRSFNDTVTVDFNNSTANQFAHIELNVTKNIFGNIIGATTNRHISINIDYMLRFINLVSASTRKWMYKDIIKFICLHEYRHIMQCDINFFNGMSGFACLNGFTNPGLLSEETDADEWAFKVSKINPSLYKIIRGGHVSDTIMIAEGYEELKKYSSVISSLLYEFNII